MNKRPFCEQRVRGFTLVELVIGMVVLAIAMLSMNTMLTSQSKDALEPLYRLRAAQLGQSILQDILARSFDQNSDPNGGYFRCGEIWRNGDLWYDANSKTWVDISPQQAVPCTNPADYGPDSGEDPDNHSHYNDVDDFIEVNFVSVVNYGDALDQPYATEYTNYLVKIAVTPYINSTAMKLIEVTIRTPSGEEILFSALKGNY
ncbi:prepilin-type N-terminal cleavage/methylation domain-containing protein [Psychromonas sp. MME2]|uniref:prepilin-type N-terminal cleavage/methylation domain-containing protein n=1 Tax=unclassified Psychromonas TaxID=2614957 RepID=UPI00339CD136